jgi:hypothetical protein
VRTLEELEEELHAWAHTTLTTHSKVEDQGKYVAVSVYKGEFEHWEELTKTYDALEKLSRSPLTRALEFEYPEPLLMACGEQDAKKQTYLALLKGQKMTMPFLYAKPYSQEWVILGTGNGERHVRVAAIIWIATVPRG